MIVSIRYKEDILVDFEIDAEDVHYLIGYKFLAAERNGKFYLVNRENNQYFHRSVMGNPKGLWIDHIDGNPTNNTKANLRTVTPAQNSYNQSKAKDRSSQFKGVCFYPKLKKYRAYINHAGKRINIGYFKNEAEAGNAYNEYAVKLFGIHARLNPIDT